jgi:cyclic beta-1,2-glucan synthetase
VAEARAARRARRARRRLGRPRPRPGARPPSRRGYRPLLDESAGAAEADAAFWARTLLDGLGVAAPPTDPALAGRLEALARRGEALVDGMDFSYLFDPQRKIFATGYRLADADGPGRLDSSYYDLLASEARLASFIAIAKGDVPQSHWFRLGRPVTSIDGQPALLSWSATMFEYLMPLLVMKTTRTRSSTRAAGWRCAGSASRGKLGVPGHLEVGHSRPPGNYQYRAFGVPGLGLKRGLADDVVVAPYARAATGWPPGSGGQPKRLAREGLEGKYGYYEAIDYTPRKTYGPGRRGRPRPWRRREGVLALTTRA